jgi:hypothetical protein
MTGLKYDYHGNELKQVNDKILNQDLYSDVEGNVNNTI